MGLMKTLTITEAKKNLGKWLNAAVKGEEVGIITGSAIVALHPIEVRPATAMDKMPIDYEYLRTEYGISREEADAPMKNSAARLERQISRGDTLTIEHPTLEKLEKIVAAYRRSHRPATRAVKSRTGRRLARAA